MVQMPDALKLVFASLSLCAQRFVTGFLVITERDADEAAISDQRTKKDGQSSWVQLEGLKSEDANVFAMLVRNNIGDRSTYHKDWCYSHYEDYLKLVVYIHGEVLSWTVDKYKEWEIVKFKTREAILMRVIAVVHLSDKNGNILRCESGQTTLDHQKRWKRSADQRYRPIEALVRAFQTLATFSAGGKRAEGCEWKIGNVVYSYSQRDAARKAVSCAIQMADIASKEDAQTLLELFRHFHYPNYLRRKDDEERFILEELDLMYEAHREVLEGLGFKPE